MEFEQGMRFLVQTEWLHIDPDAFIGIVKKLKISDRLIRSFDSNEVA